MLLRANTLAKGCSGARIQTAELLLDCLNRGVLPHVPSRGSVGASGIWRRWPTSRFRSSARARPGRRRAHERGEDCSVGLGPALNSRRRKGLADQRHAIHGRVRRTGSLRARRLAKPRTSRARCRSRRYRARGSFIPEIHDLRPLRGPARLGRERRSRLLEGSAINESHRWCDQVQTRNGCAARRRSTALRVPARLREATVAVELNAATDNPLVLVDEGCSCRTATSTGSRSPLRSMR